MFQSWVSTTVRDSLRSPSRCLPREMCQTEQSRWVAPVDRPTVLLIRRSRPLQA